MASAPFVLGGYQRTGFPGFSQLNLFAEKSPNSQDRPFALKGRPGLAPYAVVGGGPIRALYRRPGTFSDGALVLSGQTLYLLASNLVQTTFTGSVPGRTRVSIASGRDADNKDVARIANGRNLFKVIDGAVSVEDFPAAGFQEAVIDVAQLRGFWIAIKADSQQAYYLIPGDAEWTALSFASLEYQSDVLVGVETLGDQIFFFGAVTIEVWALTGQADPAIQPYSGLNFDIGCRNRDTVVNVGQKLIWVANDCSVRLTSGGVPETISDHGLAERIRKSDPMSLRAWGYTLDQHVYYVLTLEDETWVYDGSSNLWNPAGSKGQNFWRAHIGSDISSSALAADAIPTSAKVWRLDPDRLTDDSDEIERLATAYLEWKGPETPCSTVSLLCEVGDTQQAADPKVWMRYSNNDGKSWTDREYKSLGRIGETVRPTWRRLGLIRAPGRIFQFGTTDPAVVRFSDVRVNEDL